MPEEAKTTETPVKPEDEKESDMEHVLDHAEDLVEECKKAGKLFYKSKVFWFNALSIALLAGTYLCGFKDYAEVGGIIVAIANLGLRWITKEPLVVK